MPPPRPLALCLLALITLAGCKRDAPVPAPPAGSAIGLHARVVRPAGTVPNLEQARQVRIERVDAGSPADEAGVRAGDVLLSVAGEPVTGAASAMELVGRARPGQELRLGLLRGDQRLELAVVPRARGEVFPPEAPEARP